MIETGTSRRARENSAERVGGTTQGGVGGANDGLPVSEARDIDVQRDEPFQRPPGPAAVGVERSEDDIALMLGDGVPGQQQPGLGKVQGDATGGVTWNRKHHGSATELQDVLVADPAASGGPYHHGDLRRALLDAAASEIARIGIADFSLRALARATSVSHAAPTHHFGD